MYRYEVQIIADKNFIRIFHHSNRDYDTKWIYHLFKYANE